MNRKNSFLFAAFIILFLPSCTTFNRLNAEEIKKTEKEIVVLIHGLGRNRSAMWWLDNKLEDAGYQVARVGYESLSKNPDEILAIVKKQVDDCCVNHSKTVHFVGHSLGGLIDRAYLQENKVKNLGHVVLIGSPNQGTELVDYYKDRKWASIAGPMTLSLGTDSESFPKSLEAPYYPVGVIAGVAGDEDNDHILPGKDDGLVTVEATKLDGMTDFREIEVSHAMMRYNEDVVKYTVAFLKYGSFSNGDDKASPE